MRCSEYSLLDRGVITHLNRNKKQQTARLLAPLVTLCNASLDSVTLFINPRKSVTRALCIQNRHLSPQITVFVEYAQKQGHFLYISHKVTPTTGAVLLMSLYFFMFQFFVIQ